MSSTNDNYKYFSHTACEYFPCHPNVNQADFNCLFFYCPLYVLGENCGGDFVYLANGIKDCSNCLKPHKRENYDEIIAHYQDIVALMKQK